MKNFCPVCGYDFKETIEDSMICICCGTQYGYHDSAISHAQLRTRWLNNGAKWHSRRIPPPAGWSAAEQIHNVPGMRGTYYSAIPVTTAGSVSVGGFAMAGAHIRSTDFPIVSATVQGGKGFLNGLAPHLDNQYA